MPDAGPRYSLDSSILIENWQRRYPPDVFPSIWELTDDLITSGAALVSYEVFEELKKKDDELLAWVKERERYLAATDPAVQARTTVINDAHPGLTDPDRERGVADAFVIAVAELNGCDVVTYEKPRTRVTKPEKIPDVVDARRIVKCIDFVELARREGFAL